MAVTDLDYAKVVGRFALTVGDTADPGDDPDIIWCDQGTVSIEPLQTFTKVVGAAEGPFTAGNSVIQATIDSTGHLSFLGKSYVFVVDLTSDKVNPQIGPNKATHKIRFSGMKAGGTAVDFPTIEVRLTKDGPDGDGVNDLTDLAPVVAGASTPIYRGEKGTGILGAAIVDGDQLQIELTDGTTLEAGTLPAGPGGSNVGVAGYIETEGPTKDALLASTESLVSDLAPSSDDPRLVRVPIASRCMAYTSGLSTAGPTQATSRVKHRVNAEAGTVQLAYGNFYNNAGQETNGPNAITVKATVEFAIGSGPTYYYVPVTFQGARTVTIQPGGIVWSDPVPLDHAVGEFFYSRTNVAVSTGTERWPVGWATLTADGEGVITGFDYSESGVVTPGNVFCYSPLAIRGLAPSTHTKVLGGIGDSIMSGAGDGNTKGWWFRKFSGVVPEQRISYSSEMALLFNQPTRRRLRLPLLDGCTHLICGNGINDVKAGNAAIQIKRDLVTNWRYGARRGMRVWQTTLTPVTTSSDAWATTGNQAVTANEANRVEVNNWLRDGAPINAAFEPQAIGATGSVLRQGAAGHPLTGGRLEFADAVETSRNSGIWKAPAYTNDGTHPLGDAGHGALAASFTLAQLGLA